MNYTANDLYVQVQDQHGAVASIFTSFDGRSRIVYKDAAGNKFFEEDFQSFSIEVVERYAIDWATGNRNLEEAA